MLLDSRFLKHFCPLCCRPAGCKEELNGVRHIFQPAGIRISFSFVKDTLVCQAQLPVNTLIESPDVHSHWYVGLTEKVVLWVSLGVIHCYPALQKMA